jgi:hypothetical protein
MMVSCFQTTLGVKLNRCHPSVFKKTGKSIHRWGKVFLHIYIPLAILQFKNNANSSGFFEMV